VCVGRGGGGGGGVRIDERLGGGLSKKKREGVGVEKVRYHRQSCRTCPTLEFE
jgi:hypothetical protein